MVADMVTFEPALAACYALAQLAWSNEQNSFRIPLLPNLLDSLAGIFEVKDDDAPMELAQEQAAVIVGNCAANSSQAAEVTDRSHGISCILGGRFLFCAAAYVPC